MKLASLSPSTESPRREPRSNRLPREGSPLSFLFGWLWRIAAGVALCFNAFPIGFFTSIAEFGWFYRWTQGRVLRGWWKQSRLSTDISFGDFTRTLGPTAPVSRPRWFWRERIGDSRAALSGQAPGFIRRNWHLLTTPVHSLWLNFKIGVQGLFCTYLLIGWGCLLMWVSWEFGWVNSFNKGYEQAFLGPVTGILGSLLLIAALFYVPMAQVHQAVAGEARAFFHFGVIWELVRVRLTANFFLVLLILFFSLVLEVARVMVLSENFFANDESMTDAEGMYLLRNYLLGWTVFLFLALLATRGLAARIYRSAVLKALREGTLRPADLPRCVQEWLAHLDILPEPQASVGGLLQVVRHTGWWGYRKVMFGMLFLALLAFVLRFYVGYFLVANDFTFFVHPLIDLPCLDWTPPDLWYQVMGY